MIEHASGVRPCRGETVAGDTAFVRVRDGSCVAAIVDVLGHGVEAHGLVPVVEGFLARHAGGDVAEVMGRLHERLRGSRGAAVGLCHIDTGSGRLEYVGIGNTVLRRFGSVETRLVSRDGVLGQNMRKPQVQRLLLKPGDLVLLYTDGVKDRFGSDDYPGVLHHPPAEAVHTILERFSKDHDDAACVALRYAP